MRRSTCVFTAVYLSISSILCFSPDIFAFPVQMGLAPDNSQNLLLSAIKSAEKQLKINIYQFDSPAIADAIIDRVRAGVTVQLLVEGEPLGQVSPDGKKILAAIRSAMNSTHNPSNKIFVMTSPTNYQDTDNKGTDQSSDKKRRFRYNHAKYVLVDDVRVLITSENFTATGHAKKGDVGNRGWSTAFEEPKIAAHLKALFRMDTDLSYGDVKVLGNGNLDLPTPPQVFPSEVLPEKVRTIPAFPEGRGDASGATLVTSPNATEGLLNLIRSARDHLEIEQMSFPSLWKNGDSRQNPVLTELLRAAQRGVNVRVLLNDDSVFSSKPEKPSPFSAVFPSFGLWNSVVSDGLSGLVESTEEKKKANVITAETIETAAKCGKLPIEARIVSVKNLQITYIHNKGITVDGRRAFVSSINLTQNSVMNNREVAVVLESKDAAAYFGNAFDFDWQNSPEFAGEVGACLY